MKPTKQDICHYIDQYLQSFEKVLYEDDEQFLKGMQTNSLANDDLRKYEHWEWTQGVGLYGVWKLYDRTKDERYKNILARYYAKQFEIGLPSKNVNTVTPLLPLSYMLDELDVPAYRDTCREWAEWIYKDFPRTKEGGLQHITSDSVNEGELWDDTLFMTVLFLDNMGRVLNRPEYCEEAEYQFLLHVKYLADRKTGLWYHGWSFKEKSHFAAAFWGRGNCWITAAIPEFLAAPGRTPAVRKLLIATWRHQVEALLQYQEPNGMWHTVVDDPDSYVEASATCGFAYGILKGVSLGFGEESWIEPALRALEPIIGYTDEEGVVHQVSYGTPMGRESKDFYKNIELKPMPYGQALAMLFFMESQCFLDKH